MLLHKNIAPTVKKILHKFCEPCTTTTILRLSLKLYLEWAQIHLCMKTRHDQSPDISEDDYNKFSDPEKKSQKFMKKTKFKKSVTQLPTFP